MSSILFRFIWVVCCLAVVSLGWGEGKESTHWKAFQSATDRSPANILTDYSFAGYEHGEKAIPDVQGPVFKVTDYGAIAGDSISDEDAIRKAETGVTSLESCVTVEGRMVDVKLAQSSGSVTLDSATLAWAQTAKFAPAEFNGEPMAVCGYRLDYEWRVQGRQSR